LNADADFDLRLSCWRKRHAYNQSCSSE
jgi:hypothetical protein